MNKKEQIMELGKIGASIFHFTPYVKIQEPGDIALNYEMWPHLRDFFDFLDRHRLTILVKPKQVGVSWGLAKRALRKIYTIPGANVLEFSSGQKEAQKLLQKSRVIYDNLPDWMKVYTVYPDSTEQFGFKEMKSMITALPSTEKAGIGETSDWVIHDEADFHDYFEVNLGHTLATVADDPSRELTIVSTIDKTKPDSYFKQLFKGAVGSGFHEAGSNSFHALFYPYNVRPNRDESFLEEMKRQNIDTPWAVDANYPISIEQALSPLMAQSCFNKERLERLWYNVIEEPETRQGYIYILCPPRVGTQYVGGVDVGEGVGLDYSCLTIIGKEGLREEVCAVIYSNEVATDLFALDCDRLGREYFNAKLVVENNSLGVAVINKLQELGYPNLYKNEKGKMGFTTGDKNKQPMLIEMGQDLDNGSLITRFKPQVKELQEYQWVNGKMQPTGKTHGDTVISLGLAHFGAKKVGIIQEPSMYVAGRRIF